MGIRKRKTTPEELAEKQAWSLEQKVKHSLKKIKEFYDFQKGEVFVAYSGGKDSTALLHLVRTLYPDVEAVFCNTTNEYKEILEQIANTPNCITLQPKMNFRETIKKYGFPLVSKRVSGAIPALRNPSGEKAGEGNFNIRRLYMEGITSKGVKAPRWKLAKKWKPLIDAPFDITNKCCEILKKEPSRRYERETGKKAYVGTQAGESIQRKDSYLETGCNTFEGHIKSHPLSIWSEDDIWEYIHLHELKYASVYDDYTASDGTVLKGLDRTGCAYCAFGVSLECRGERKDDLNRFQKLSKRKPKQFEKMMQLENNGVSFEDALKFIGVEVRKDDSVIG